MRPRSLETFPETRDRVEDDERFTKTKTKNGKRQGDF